VSVAPLNALSYFPDQGLGATVPVVDYQISSEEQFESTSAAAFGYRLSRRGQVSFRADYRYSRSMEPRPDPWEFRGWTAAGTYTHSTSRYMSVYGGYAYSVNESALTEGNDALDGTSEARPALRTLHAGVNYARTLSFSRRTSLSFTTGSSAFDSGGSGQYELIGSVALRHMIGRTWSIDGTYGRSAFFTEPFLEPVFTNGISGRIGGRLSRSTALNVNAHWSRGSVGVAEVGNEVDSASASLKFRYIMRRRLALLAEYFYFQSTFGPLVTIPDSLGPQQRRYGVRVGLSLGTTLLGPRR
jgi:hypothetical protein